MYDIGVGNGFLDMTTKAQTTERKKDKLDFIKSKNFCNAEDTIKKVKRQHRMGENICKSYLIRDLYLANIKNSYNSTLKTQITQF